MKELFSSYRVYCTRNYKYTWYSYVAIVIIMKWSSYDLYVF